MRHRIRARSAGVVAAQRGCASAAAATARSMSAAVASGMRPISLPVAGSIVGIVAQFSYALVLSPLVQAKGPGVIAFPVVILVIALGSMAYAHAAAGRDLLS